MTDAVDCIVAGAGVIGLAVGRRLALAGHDVFVVEAEDRIGAHTSSRNSEVIHAGIYYPTDSLKARLCVAGKQMLYDYCAARGVAHRRIGKIIVASSSDDEATLERIRHKALANGVDDLTPLSATTLAELEPAVRAGAALLSPSTGIIDSHEYMLSLQSDLEGADGQVVLKTRVSALIPSRDGFEVALNEEPVPSVRCRAFVNAAGLQASRLASLFRDMPSVDAPRTRYARGHYFSYSGPSPFRHLVYPIPIDGGLGVHATNDLSGRARFGPDVQWIDDVDYRFPEGLEGQFIESVRRYFPGLKPDKLSPSYTGIRPKISGPGEPPADFRIDGPEAHRVPGLVNLFGMESPGLTASLAIADHVYELLRPELA